MTPPSSSPDSPSPNRPARRATPQDGKRVVAERLRARKRRASLIRRRSVAIVATVFVAAWSVIFIQLASGHDPVLSRQSAVVTTTTGTGTTDTSSSPSSSATTSSSGTSGSGSGSSGTASSGSSASAPAPVTTSQS